MEKGRIVLSGRNKMTVIEMHRITHIEAEDHYALIRCPGETFAVRKSLRDVESALNGHGFIKVHRSFLVSLEHVKKIEDGWIVLDDFKETEIPIGANYEKKIIEEMKIRDYLFL